MHRQHHKMHAGEIIFHLAVPAIMLAITVAMGYYVVVLIRGIMVL
ncbi:MAG: hypothetical protein ACD_67C00244G0001 [uncultured bacterium]|nr:MAG: hypothetical protein ACD_67C00244G0001 [uncultured bacterium]